MFQALRKRLHLSPATAIATLALVFAMTGGAYAAKKYLITSTKQISPSVLKALTGKAGPAGAKGANGANGSNGANGAQGPQGPAGSNGSNGQNGANGESVTAKAAGGECSQGGTAFTVGGKTEHVCNGKNGTIGFTETLPAGKTETGIWSFGPVSIEGGAYNVPVASFAIPLKEPLVRDEKCENEENGAGEEGPCPERFINTAGKEVNLNGEEVESANCKGTVAKPTAQPGNLCIYTGSLLHARSSSLGLQNSGVAGAFLEVNLNGVEPKGYGTWAVTAPES